VSRPAIRGVLFDLDGTLVDSAPDLSGTVNDLRGRRGLKPLPHARLRPFATRGALGLLEAGFPDLDPTERESMRDEFLDRYRQRLWIDSRPFPGMGKVLGVLHIRGIRLGIVTNKVESLARPLVEQAGWHHLFSSLVAGDTTPRPKPDAAPVLAACNALDLPPANCVLIGDDLRDVLAGKAAGSQTVAVSWGYHNREDDPGEWGADRLIHHVEEILELTGASSGMDEIG
jgi:2-phosphoglycolate phosphatase